LLNIYWKTKKFNIILNALFRLLKKNYLENNFKSKEIFDKVVAYYIILIKIALIFKKSLTKIYKINKK